MAPMIDMVFLLLVFFMTVSTLAKEARPEIDLPVSTTAAVPEAAPPRDVLTVMAGKSGYTYYWHNKRVQLEDIPPLLEGSSGGRGELLLRGAPDLPWEAWEQLLPVIREAGAFEEIVMATFED